MLLQFFTVYICILHSCAQSVSCFYALKGQNKSNGETHEHVLWRAESAIAYMESLSVCLCVHAFFSIYKTELISVKFPYMI